MTRNLFLAAKKQYTEPTMNLEKLDFSIAPASWLPIDSLDGKECEDCWITSRSYHILLVTIGNDMTFIADGLAEFLVVPVVDAGITN